MGLLASAWQPLIERRAETYDNLGNASNPSVTLLNMLGGTQTAAGIHIDERTAEGIPAIYACTHVISETTGQLPLKLMRLLEQGGKKADPSHALYSVLHDLSNPEMTAYQVREQMTRHLALWGRAYAQIIRDARGQVTALWPLHPSRMTVDRDEFGRKRWRYWMAKGDYRTWVNDPARPPIMHLWINGDDGPDGRSPLAINRESLGITKAAEKFAGAWFGNGAIPGVVLTHPGKLKRETKQVMRESWLERFMGASNANKLAILDEGVKIDVIGVDPQKSQLIDLQHLQIEQAARIWRVPLFMIQAHTKDTAWGTGIEQMMLGFVNLTLMPYLMQWQQAVARDLLTLKSFETHQAVFVLNALVRGDIKTRFDAYSTARQNGIFDGNELRELEDMNPRDEAGAKVLWMPSNMMQASTLPVMIEPDPDPEPTLQPTAPEPEGVM